MITNPLLCSCRTHQATFSARDAGSETGLDHITRAEQIVRLVGEPIRALYIEAEFFAGTGNQAAVGWEHSGSTLAPA